MLGRIETSITGRRRAAPTAILARRIMRAALLACSPALISPTPIRTLIALQLLVESTGACTGGDNAIPATSPKKPASVNRRARGCHRLSRRRCVISRCRSRFLCIRRRRFIVRAPSRSGRSWPRYCVAEPGAASAPPQQALHRSCSARSDPSGRCAPCLQATIRD